MKPLNQVQLSMLDLIPVREGSTVADALHFAVRTAQCAERLGFARYWVAEHHNLPNIASSATAVLVGHIAGKTSTIRVGAGGIMLPNHAPLVVAEAFGTMAELYPERIDLGLGRAPGTDGPTMHALRRDRVESEDDFPRDVQELLRLLGPAQPGQRITAMPGAGTNVPIWLLGSGLFAAQLAAHLGLPYAFASHFAPRMLHQALDVYRQTFQPSAALTKPYAMVGVPVIAAASDAEARFLASSSYQNIRGILTNNRTRLPPPVEGFMDRISERERAAIAEFLAVGVIGGPATVRQGLQTLADATDADEFIMVSDIFDPELRLRSLEITAQAMRG